MILRPDELMFELEKTIQGTASIIVAIDKGENVNVLKAIKAICKSQHRIAACLYGQYLIATTKEIEGRTKEEFDKIMNDRVKFLAHSMSGEIYEPVSGKRSN